MSLLSRDQILSAADIKFDDVKVPEWGGTVRLMNMNGARREQFEEQMLNPAIDTRAALAAVSIVGEDNNLLFTVEDITELSQKSYAALNRIFEAARKLNGMMDSGEIEKNSERDQDGNSSSS